VCVDWGESVGVFGGHLRAGGPGLAGWGDVLARVLGGGLARCFVVG
jgi:hypothetical protein